MPRPGWNKKLGYCVAFSADGAMDVTRRYVRNPAKHSLERTRAPESVLLHIMDEIRALRRQNLSKQDKFKLEGEDMREDRELRNYIIGSIAAEICKIVPGELFAGNNARGGVDVDAQKAAEAGTERQRARRGAGEQRHGHQGAPRDQEGR
ncbi:MAG: hypothetical protein INR71_06415 [Terriglobus roseus]|nr:hypothetical protein [Terriglobus roseus]